MEATTYYLIAIIVASLALVISLINSFVLYFKKLKLLIIPELQVQVMEASQNNKFLLAYNILFTIISQGSGITWNTFKFMTSILTTPDGRPIEFECRSYIEEKGMGQSNASRNIPVAINGNNSKILTVAFQSDKLSTWNTGKYKLEFDIRDSNDVKIECPLIEFILDENSLKIIKQPQSILMVKANKK
jgi:hypothetical protein